MYIHAYQSLIWNELVSRRIAKFGLNVCEGDLVYATQADENTEIIDDVAIDEEVDTAENTSEDANPCAPTLSRFQAMVKALTKADVESNTYSIFDVVMPLPGHDITYPTNEVSQWYAERLAQDDLSSEKLKRKHK